MSRSGCTLDESFTKGKQAENAENQRFFTEKPSIYAVFRLIPPLFRYSPAFFFAGRAPAPVYSSIFNLIIIRNSNCYGRIVSILYASVLGFDIMYNTTNFVT